jgi:hypothetical protein
MPFDTPAGPAVLIENICDIKELSVRLGVHYRSVQNWALAREKTNFPEPIPNTSKYYDYAEVYDWFQEWVRNHPRHYPIAFISMLQEES